MAAGFALEAESLGALLSTPMTPKALSAFAWRTWRAKGTGRSRELLRLHLSSPRDFLKARFEHPRVRAMMAVWGTHLDFAPAVAGGAAFPHLESFRSQAVGMVIGRGGADVAIRAMTGVLSERGGHLETGSQVVRTEREGGRAAGVTLADGRRIRARRAVIAGVAPRGMLRPLGDDPGEASYAEALRRFRHAPGTLMIHLALDGPAPWAASDEFARFAYVHMAPTRGGMDRTYAEAVSNPLPAEPAVVVGQPTAVDPSRAPEGTHVLWVQVRMVPGRIEGDAAGEIEATGWAEAGEPFAERVLDLIERHAPGLRDRITARRVMTPDDLEAWNPNLVGGDQVAGSPPPVAALPVPSRARAGGRVDAAGGAAPHRRLALARRRHGVGVALRAGRAAGARQTTTGSESVTITRRGTLGWGSGGSPPCWACREGRSRRRGASSPSPTTWRCRPGTR